MLFETTVDMIANTWKLQRAYLFELALPDIGGIAGSDVGVLCRDLHFGDYNMSELAMIMYGAFRRGYAGQFQIETMRTDFLMTVPDIVQAYMARWKSMIVNERGEYYPKMNYAATVYANLYDRDGTEAAVFKLTGVFPKTFPSYHLSHHREEAVTYPLEFNVDRVYLVSAGSGVLGIIEAALGHAAATTIGRRISQLTSL